jgi:hypothetical protein
MPFARRLSVLPGLLAAACVADPELQGPLPVRNQHPAQLTALHPPPASALVLPSGAATLRADAAYTSLFLAGQDVGNRFFMDGEYLRTAFGAKVGLGADLELWAELPVAHTGGGFLDDFLIGYHRALGLPGQGRTEAPRDAFAVVAEVQGQTAWQVEPRSLTLLDVPLGLTWMVRDPAQGLGMALRAAVELPTGDAAAGYGSGGVDAAVGVLLEHRCLGMAWYGHLQHSFVRTPRPARAAGLRFGDVTSAGLALELPLGPSLHAFAQVEYETSVLRGLGSFDEAASPQCLVWLGGRFRLGPDYGLEVAVAEDLIGYVSPDVTFWLGFTSLPRRRSGGG